MAIYSIGAYFNNDISEQFIKRKIVGIGWDEKDAPDLHEYIKSLKVGDIVYIKSAPPGGNITVKAIGIITDSECIQDKSPAALVKIYRRVKWICKNKFVLKPSEINGKNNVRSNTIYEEFSPKVQKCILKEFKFI
jgi:hypothetical protein